MSALYSAAVVSVTQVVDLLEGIRCSGLPLLYERIIEVQYRDWLVAPSVKKDGSFNSRRAPIEESPEDEEEDDESNGEEKGLLNL